MAYKIVVDAGHGGEDPGAVNQGRKEKDDNLKIALELGKILEQNGIDVVFTRTTDVYQTPFEKAQIANRAGADYFISLHRNSSERNNQYNGVESLVYDKSGVKLDMAENINGALGELGFKNLGVKERPGLVVLRRTNMPAVLVEMGFINSDEDNETFDKNEQAIAQAIADGILGTLDELEAAKEQSDENSSEYRVQTGAFRQKRYADAMEYELQNRGYDAYIVQENGYYKVQTGMFPKLADAIMMERKLRKDGFQTFIVG